MALKSGPCGRCVGLTRGETGRQSGADMRLHNHGIARTPVRHMADPRLMVVTCAEPLFLLSR
eukprot:7179758-Prymnesium_polylepis.1